MKMSKAERKAYNLGRRVGRAEGYADGLHDGNPLITIAEAARNVLTTISEKLQDPEFVEYVQQIKEEAEKVKEEEEEEEITLQELPKRTWRADE